MYKLAPKKADKFSPEEIFAEKISIKKERGKT